MTERDYGEERLTASARQRLAKELESLRAAREEFRQSLDSNAPLGDLADQAESLERSMSRNRLEERINDIERLLARAEDVEPSGDVVDVGTVVTVRFPDGDKQSLRVGELVEADDETAVLTPDSPLGRALLGRRPGESVTYTAPGGETRAEVISVEADQSDR